MPPVGITLNIGNGALIALILAMPPDCSGGEELKDLEAELIGGVIIGRGGATGKICTPNFLAVGDDFRDPCRGVTMNYAPAAIASSTGSVVRTVPAPTSISG